jgi:hypothetical protein
VPRIVLSSLSRGRYVTRSTVHAGAKGRITKPSSTGEDYGKPWRLTALGLYVRVQKVAGDDRSATYSFTTGEGSERTLFIDLDEDRIWPEDGNRDGIFRGAAQALARELRKQGKLPDLALLQS